MSSPLATKRPWSAAIALVATLLASGCQDYASRRDTIAFHAGEAAAHNKAVHIIDPWPAAAARAEIASDGSRAVRTMERYESGGSIIVPSGGAATGAPLPPTVVKP
jgi:hypothetical protein